MPRDLTGRVVVITGAARGIGLATARAVHAMGARLAIGDLDGAFTESAAAAIGPEVLAGALDVGDEASYSAFLARVEQALGPVDVLISNAGIMPLGRFHEQALESDRRLLNVNLMGVIIGMKLVIPGMLDRGGGQIVNMASVAGKSPAAGGITYSAVKAGVVMLTEAARVEYAGSGLHFTCVMPSFTATDLIAGTKGTRFIGTVSPEQVGQAIARATVRRSKDVWVPGSLGPTVKVQQILGRRVRDAMGRVLGADKTFIELDDAARSAYAERVSREAAGNPNA